MKDNNIHIGRKISRLRELRGMKQEALAEQLGISQQAISKIEQSEHVEELTLERIGKALGFTKEAIMKYNDETVLNLVQNNTYNDNAIGPNFYSTVNPLEEIKKLQIEKEELYKALLKEKDEKIVLLERMVTALEKK